MIATRRGLAAVIAVAAALVAIVLLDLAHAPAPVDRALVPGFDAAAVRELIWKRDGQLLRAVRYGDAWQLAGGRPAGVASAPADPAAIGEVLAALRGARWHRRGPAVAAATTLTVMAATSTALGLGPALDGGDQRWVTARGAGLLVDRWVARALDRDELSLRIRRPLADAGRAIAITGEAALTLDGAALVAPVALRLAPGPVDALIRALRDAEIVRLPDGPIGAASLTITADRRRLALAGACPGAPDLIAVGGSTGEGCIPAASATAIRAAIAALQRPPAELIERRPVPFEPTQIQLAGGALDVTRLRLGDQPADPARVAELVAALAAPADVVARPARPIGQLVVTGAAGAITLELFPERVVARRGEPLALRPAPGAWALLTRPVQALRDPAPWLEEPTTITAIRIDDRVYQRGATIGAWTRDGAPADGAALEALAAALAAPRVLAVLAAPIAPARRISLSVTPPVGAPARHAVILGVPRAAGCPAQIADATLLLPAAICALAAKLR